ncbi:uncharacterized protein LOC111049329 [Nilaparvata lugens]|uniref:uncharacterized protein LOC111049329 n=1 Tax=Nilaparvata lugens TaxID=108931 RepID=UPI00193D7D84|nr:uncharacterized protein LOC111049329 [Nilaparvata lugens]XP_039294381.1 uncharacterized protein LOC111049329 [Nilaparvata lugens]
MSAKKVVILTLPPVPKIAYKADHWARLNAYNDYIKSLPDKFQGKVSVADISPLFGKSSTRVCRLSCFEQWFYGGRRQDLIHINEKGFKIIRQFLLKYAL